MDDLCLILVQRRGRQPEPVEPTGPVRVRGTGNPATQVRPRQGPAAPQSMKNSFSAGDLANEGDISFFSLPFSFFSVPFFFFSVPLKLRMLLKIFLIL